MKNLRLRTRAIHAKSDVGRSVGWMDRPLRRRGRIIIHPHVLRPLVIITLSLSLSLSP